MHDYEVVNLFIDNGFSIPNLSIEELKICHSLLLTAYKDKMPDNMIKLHIRQQIFKSNNGVQELVMNNRIEHTINYIHHYINIAAETFRYCNRFIVAEFYPYWKYTINPTRRSNAADLLLKNKYFRSDDIFWDIFYPPNYVGDQSTIIALRFDEVEPGGLSTLADVSPNHQPKDGYNINIPKKILIGY